ncbi:type II secretion system protein N [Polynucleobacter sp. MWH-Adler-W8]|uniref:type II secretion system protein N n=1 Tax=Polynucleobacter sp. MWH-Adler-W8 TaxID=1819727 RepID=UPI0013018C9D|nr:type II secretion system protein N [Polynucleobacter sp. MWH-Adler-W8]
MIPTSPANLTKFVTYLLMLACAISATYWLMRLVQIPGTPNQPSNGISKGLTLYSNQDATAGYALFGSKPLVTENIYLRGVVATSKNPDGSLDGFAIFEIDGKPTNAISVGETIGKGLSLQSIGDESAILLYQGQRLSFKLNKATKDKSDKTSSSNKK